MCVRADLPDHGEIWYVVQTDAGSFLKMEGGYLSVCLYSFMSRRLFEDGQEGKEMRLDKYLKVSRLIKRRTVANEACDAGRVLVNGKAAKASVSVKPGDVLEIQFGSKAVKVEVLNVQETVKKEAATEMYRYL